MGAILIGMALAALPGVLAASTEDAKRATAGKIDPGPPAAPTAKALHAVPAADMSRPRPVLWKPAEVKNVPYSPLPTPIPSSGCKPGPVPPPGPAATSISRPADKLEPRAVRFAKSQPFRNAAPQKTTDAATAPKRDPISIAWEKRIVYRLKNAPAMEIANAINQFYAGDGAVRVVPELVSNSLLIGALPNLLDEVVRQVEKLDRRPAMVSVEVCLVELKTTAKADRAETAESKKDAHVASAQRLSIAGNDIAAQLGELKKLGQVATLCRSQLMTLDNQPAFVHVGQRVATVRNSGDNSKEQGHAIRRENVGLMLGVTPRVGPDNTITMEIDVEQSSVGPLSEGVPIAAPKSPFDPLLRAPSILVTSMQSTISVADGKTLTLGRMVIESTVKGQVERRELVVLVAPRIIAAASPAVHGR